MGGACFEDEVGIECGCRLGAVAIKGCRAMKKGFRS